MSATKVLVETNPEVGRKEEGRMKRRRSSPLRDVIELREDDLAFVE